MEKLTKWQQRLADADRGFASESAKMEARERLYTGDHELKPLTPGDRRWDGGVKKTSHVRNIVFENVEAQVASSIPQPKVTPRRKKDEHLAEVIEHFLRNELDRLPFETLNDIAERTVPIQGGVGFLIEWDNTRGSYDAAGELVVRCVHPKQFAPQPGVFTGIRDMDWFIVKNPTTKEAVRRKYGVDVSHESEQEPDVRGGKETAEDAVTEYTGYEINDEGGINRYTWVNDIELEDLENYQARRQPVCRTCGRMRPLPGTEPPQETALGVLPLDRYALGTSGDGTAAAVFPVDLGEASGDVCPYCGGTEFTSREQEFEEIYTPIQTANGTVIEGAHPGLDENGMLDMVPTKIPFYKPDVYPIILQKSVSVYGQLLGNSDVDVIADQQNTLNRMGQKIIDRFIKAGTRITMPDRAELRVDPEDSELWYIGSAADKALIDVYDFKGDLEYEMVFYNQVYEEARQALGITDSFQGRKDTTATSGTAKEFSAAQAAGRLESKRVMKQAAYAEIFELMFKFALAYSDEPRTVSYQSPTGETEYEEFNRYDFLELGEDGAYHWNDQFLFSCDTTQPLANNREALWQETRQNLQTGAFGDPSSTETLVLFWAKMEELHYPGAATTKSFLEDRLQREQQAAQMQAQMQQAAQMQQQTAQQAAGGGAAISSGLLQAVDEKARQDAQAAAQGRTGAP